MKNPKFTIFKSTADGQYYYRLKAANGEIILNGEGYTSKQACEKGIASVKSNARKETSFSKSGNASGYGFNIKAANGEVIGRSEKYTSKQNRDKGIAAVMNTAETADIEYA